MYFHFRRKAILSFLLFPLFGQLKAGDTLKVVSHRNEIIVTDPSTGSKAYPRWAAFPSSKVPVRKIVLHVTFGCPDSTRCADWDYLDRIFIRRTGHASSPSKDFEIARMLTPYGGAFGHDWNFSWDVDITHFSTLLRDSVEIEYEHTGYEPNKDRGWKINVEFEIIKGTPAQEIISVTKVYDGKFPYGDSTKPLEDFLKPFAFKAADGAAMAELIILQTGHGMDSEGCGEFCDRYREVLFDGKVVDKRNIWKKCGDNPLYPQAGTWLIDRAYWCPGNLMQPDIIGLPLEPGSEHTVDVNMQPYVNKEPSAMEAISVFLVQYKKPRAKHDVSLVDITAPSSKQIHSRFNSACVNPSVIVSNDGTESIQQLTFQYGTKGFPLRTHRWSGTLPAGEKKSITLPGTIDAKSGKNIFQVNVTTVNGKKDEYKTDNVVVSAFEKAPQHGPKVIVVFQTNHQPEHNAYQVSDATGKIIFERKLGSLQANKNYRDTLSLPGGCYTFAVQDTASDGLEFWFNREGGRGFCRLLDEQGRLLKHFESDFGSSLQYNFAVSPDGKDLSAPLPKPSVGLFPTRTKGPTTLDFFSNEAQETVVEIVSDPGGEVVERHVYQSLKEGVFSYDLSYRPAQRYYLKVYLKGELIFNKRIRVGE